MRFSGACVAGAGFFVSLFSAPCLAGPENAFAIHDAQQIAERVAGFQHDLQKLGFQGTIESCTHMMKVAVGVAGGNMAYGATCGWTVGGKTVHAMMCEDEMIGNFALTVSFAWTDDEVAEFTNRNCLVS